MYNKSLTGHNFVTCCFLIFLFHLTVCTSAIAQKPITGFLYVIDSGNNIVPNIKVKVVCCGNSIEGLTDERGQFIYSIPETDSCSHATVSISNSLYSPIDTVVNLRQPSRIQITLNPIKLKEVEIIAYQPVAKENAERVSFKINMKGLLKNAKADMALRSIPNIIYSDGTFRLTGKTSKAKILVNGIETTEEELTKLDAGDIDRVDLHKIGLNDDTNSGEINIILKKKSVSLYKGEIDMGGNLFKGGNITPSFTYRSKIFDLVTWLSYARERQKSRYEIVRDGNEAYSSENRSHLQQYSAMFRLNVTSSPKLMMAFSGSFFGYSSPADVDWKLNGISENPQRVKETYYSNYANLVIRYNLSHKERLFVKGRYFRYTSKNRSDNPSTQYRGNMNEATVDLLYEADSLRALKKYHSLAIGYKSIYRNSTLTSSNKKYVSDVQQLYIKDNIMLNRHWGLFLLLRNEFDGYKFEGNRTARKYSFLPSVNLNPNRSLEL